MAYDSSTGKITAPVSISDVQKCFGLSSGDLGTLIKNAKINMWAKYKPVRLSKSDTVTGQWDFSKNKWLDSADWFQSNDGYCGLNPTSYVRLGSPYTEGTFLCALYHDQLPITYNRPGGDIGGQYRLQDFAGYLVDAKPFLYFLAYGGSVIYIKDKVTVDLIYAINAGEGQLSPADFKKDFYLSVMLRFASGGFQYISSLHKCGEDNWNKITVTLNADQIGRVDIYPFLSSKILGTSGNDDNSDGIYMGLGYTRRTSAADGMYADFFNLVSSYYDFAIRVSGQFLSANKDRIGINITVQNYTDKDKTFKGGVTVYLYETPQGADPSSNGTVIGGYSYTSDIVTKAHDTLPLQKDANGYAGYITNVSIKNGKSYFLYGVFKDGTSTEHQYIPLNIYY